jgi:hypothetical protein
MKFGSDWNDLPSSVTGWVDFLKAKIVGIAITYSVIVTI